MRSVLDKGYIRLVDSMGTDETPAKMAWVSTGKTQGDHKRLINYLMKHHHMVPFEHVKLTFQVKAPVSVLRQWAKHRAGCISEASARMVPPREYYTPEVERMTTQSDFTKQGASGVAIERPDTAHNTLRICMASAFDDYDGLVQQGLNLETARQVLPLAMYSTIYWTVDLRNLMGFLVQRMDEHAQWEIRQYANAIHGIASEIFPLCMEAFDNHMLNAVTFSAKEMDAVLRYIHRGDMPRSERLLVILGLE